MVEAPSGSGGTPQIVQRCQDLDADMGQTAPLSGGDNAGPIASGDAVAPSPRPRDSNGHADVSREIGNTIGGAAFPLADQDGDGVDCGSHELDGTECSVIAQTKCAATGTLSNPTLHHTMTKPNERLRIARENAGYKGPKDAADVLELNYGTYAAHEAGKRNLTITRAKQYGRLFNVDAEWLLHGVGRGPGGATAGGTLARAALQSGQTETPETLDRRALRTAIETTLIAYIESGDIALTGADIDSLAPEFAESVERTYDGVFSLRRLARGTPPSND